MGMIVYCAGAMSCYYGTDKANYPYEWRKKAKDYVNKYCSDISIISPTDYYEIGKDYHLTEKEVMRFDLRAVRDCDVVLVNLDDLDKSLGTSDEIIYAYLRGTPIIGFTSAKDTSKVHPWKIEQINRIECGKDSLEKALQYINAYYGGNYVFKN